MKTKVPAFRSAIVGLVLLSAYALLLPRAKAQEKQAPLNDSFSTTRDTAAKKQTAETDPADAATDVKKETSIDKDGPEAIRKRDEWFYKQRSSANGRIPAGARFKAFQHMQRMMEAEGKLTLRADGSYAASATASATTPLWQSIGPTPTTGGTFSPVTGRVTTIAVDPSDSSGNTVLIGGAQGGIWRSTDAGTTWTAVGDQNPSLAMGSIAFAPSNPSVVYAGTGEQASIAFDIYYGAGVLRSANHGQTWTQTCMVPSPTCPFIGPYDDLTPFGFFTLGGTRISYVAVNPSNTQMVLVGAETQFAEGTTEGVYCSDNGGSSWTNILPDEMSTFVGFASSNVAYVALGNPFGSSSNAPNGNGIYKATGITGTCASVHFTRLTATSLPQQSTMGRIDLGIASSDATGNTLYASIANAAIGSTSNLGVFATTDGGNSWIQTAAPDVCKFQCWYDNVIKVDPNHSGTAFLGGSSVRDSSGNFSWVVRTENGGGTWSSVIPNLPSGSSGLPHVDNHAIAFAKLPTGKVRMYLGNDGGIWRTDDAEASVVTWVNLNNPSLTLTQFYPYISINASLPTFSFGGTQDNGSQNYQGGASWVDNHLCGDGASTAVDSIIPSTVYIGCATGFPVNASYQNGAIGTFFPAINGINPSDFSSFIPPLVTDPSSANTVYFGTTKVYQSVDAGTTWMPISNDLVSGSNGDSLTALAVAPANPGVVYAGANAGASSGALTGLVFVAMGVTPGNFANFVQIGGSGNLPPRALTAIAVDPADSTGKTAYVTYSGFAFVNSNIGVNDPTGHIFKTSDGGSTWKDVSCSVPVCTTPAASDLPNTPVNDLVVDPDLAGIIYAATDEGVFVGDCTTAPCKWSTLSTGLPHVVVLSLRLHEPSRTLRAATHGRGAWDISLNNFSFSGSHISSMTPTSANAGAAQFTLTVDGTGLTGGVIQFGSASLVATGTQSDTTLSGIVPTNLLVVGTAQITVKVGVPSSNALPFSVLGLTPTISSLNPPSTPVQIPTLANIPVQLTGTNFGASSKLLFNGAYSGITVAAATSSCPLPTCLSATFPSVLLGTFGSTNDIAVVSPPPGGGKSQPATFKVVAPPPPNDNFASATNITSLGFLDVQDSSGATAESTDPTPPCAHQYTTAQGNTGGQPNGRYNTIWYKFTPVFSANLGVDTISSSYDTVLSIWTGSPGSFVNVACNDDIVPGVNIQSQLSNVPLAAGATYYIMVSSFGPPDTNPLALGGRSQLNFSYNGGFYPTPTVTSLSPASAKSGDPSFMLTVSGSGFLNGASIALQDPLSQFTPLTSNFVSSTQVTATVPASAILFPGNYQVLAFNPPPSGSGNLPFTVNVGTYPVPTLTSISPSPSSVVAGTLFPVSIAAFGSNFALNAVLNVNGIPQPTQGFNHTYVLSNNVPAALFATPGTAQITVSNPAPGGGPSNSLPLTIAAPNPLPTITSISPASVPIGSPNTITITGTGFLAGAQVCINFQTALNCTSSAVNSSTQLTTQIYFLSGTGGTFPLYVADPAPGGTSGPFNFTLTGPPDFTISSSGTATQTVTAGQTATFTNAITIAAMNGFTGNVNVTCALPAADTTCAANPPSIAAGSSTTITVTTMTHQLAPPSRSPRRFSPWQRLIPVLVLAIVALALLAFVAKTRRQRFAISIPLVGAILFLVLQAAGCGGGGGSSPPPPPPPFGTQPGIYTITVTGNGGNTTHTTTLTLTVN